MAYKLIKINGAVADGEFISDMLPEWARSGVISQTFYTDAERAVPVLPTAGSITYTGTEDEFNYGKLNGGANDDGVVSPNTGDYVRAYWQLSKLYKIKAAMAGIVGANYFTIRIAVFDN